MPLTEMDTRPVPYEAIEASYANNRPYAERPPIPRVGDEVFYRRDAWDQHPVRVRVMCVQPADDRSLVHAYPGFGPARDPNLWILVRDHRGRPIVDAEHPRYVPHPDPWPQIRVRGRWPPYAGGVPEEREATCRESRMRGSPGWLPLNWRDRPVRLPHQLALTPRPYLPPLNVPLHEHLM